MFNCFTVNEVNDQCQMTKLQGPMTKEIPKLKSQSEVAARLLRSGWGEVRMKARPHPFPLPLRRGRALLHRGMLFTFRLQSPAAGFPGKNDQTGTRPRPGADLVLVWFYLAIFSQFSTVRSGVKVMIQNTGSKLFRTGMV